jgi:Dolichyl-phosphate-mannose-protein mannosyltransferase
VDDDDIGVSPSRAALPGRSRLGYFRSSGDAAPPRDREALVPPEPERSEGTRLARAPLAAGPVLGVAAAVLALHLIANAVSPYGFHRDEFLYVAMGRHLRLWRMDFPPAMALLYDATRFLGDSLVALRLAPALAAAAVVVLGGLMAREVGGGRFAQAFTVLAVGCSAFFLRSGNLFHPVVFDVLWWTVGLYALLRLCGGDPRPGRWWLLLALAGGAGLLTKFSILLLGFAVLVGLLATTWRRALRTRWPWLVLALALAIGSPSVAGQIALGWPLVGQMRSLQDFQLQHVSVAGFFVEQAMLGPAMLVAAVGLGALLLAPAMRAYRPIGWACLTVWVLLVALHGKGYYAGGTYVVLFAAGAAAVERARGRAGAQLRGWAVGLTAGWGLVSLPFGLPILEPAAMEVYAHAVGGSAALRDVQGQMLRLPLDYADMLGWPDRVAALSAAYRSLPPAERSQAVVLAGSYGLAGAADFYGPRVGLPPAVCSVGSYWFFGPGARPGGVAIAIGMGREDLQAVYDSIEAAGRITNSWAARWEQDLTIYIARRPRTTLQAVWPAWAGRFY